MDRQAIVDILNELAALEQRNLARRLVESILFVPHPAVEDSGVVRQMARASEEYDRWLAEAILELDGVPGVRLGDVHTADLHYQELRRVLPRLTVDLENLIQKYAIAADRVVDEPKAANVVARILKGHKQELASLQQAGVAP